MCNLAKAKKNGSRPPLPSKKKDFVCYTKKSSTRQKKHGYAVVYKLDLYDLASIVLESEETQSNNNTTPKLEKVILLKELIRKSTSYTWAINTKASLLITNQLYLFRDLKLTIKVPI